MKQIPILMSGPLVREILAGNKTQTRRPVKPQPESQLYNGNRGTSSVWVPRPWTVNDFVKCPYGSRIDQLWIKEGYYAYGYWIQEGVTKTGLPKYRFIDKTLKFEQEYIYQADTTLENCLSQFNTKKLGWHKRNSLFMPKTASRITLDILEIGVERLHDISEEDAKAEGVIPLQFDKTEFTESYRDGFFIKWMEIYGEESFTSNPWVWKIRFKRIEE